MLAGLCDISSFDERALALFRSHSCHLVMVLRLCPSVSDDVSHLCVSLRACYSVSEMHILDVRQRGVCPGPRERATWHVLL